MTNNAEDTTPKNEQVDAGSETISDAATNVPEQQEEAKEEAEQQQQQQQQQMPVAKPDDPAPSETEGSANNDGFQALGVCVPPMNEAEKHDWEQSMLLFVDKEKLAAAQSLGLDMITRQVRGKQFMKKDKARWKVIANTIEAHILWREKTDLGSFSSWTMENYELFRTQVWPMKLLGIDADNHPIVSLSLKECDWRASTKTFSKEQLMTYLAYFQEQLLHRYRTEFRCKYRQKIILNCRGMGMSDFSAAKSLGITKIFQILDGNYPETIEKFYLVESPWLMPKVFTFLKPFIAPDTVEKIKIWNKNSREKFIAAEPRVSVDMLPVYLGGTREGDYLFAPPGSLIGDRRKSIRPVSARDPPVAVAAISVNAN